MTDIAQTGILAGAVAGRQVFATLIGAVGRRRDPIRIILDFDGVTVATSSFLREAVLAFREYCCRGETNAYPILCNLSEAVEEEIEGLLAVRGDAIVVSGQLADEDRWPSRVRVLGSLEPKQRQTLEAVTELGEADASSLLLKFASSDLGITAWNNRLTALKAKGLLMEFRQGRSKKYRPIAKAVEYGR